MLNTQHQLKVLVTQFLSTESFFKAIFDKQTHQDPHFVSHSNVPFSRQNTTQRRSLDKHFPVENV